jgi:hypothetical protein
MTGMTTLAVYAAIASCSYCESEQPFGRLTVTENLIRLEIERLGGDWEAGEKPLLVAFLGDKFESRHFEMLKHLPSVTFFHAEDCVIDDFALACLVEVHQLERLDITRCKIESEGLSLLRGNRELKKIYLEAITVSDNLIAEIATLRHLTQIYFTDCEGITDERLSTLRTALPHAEIE